ncbi:LysR family transcriptional regulator [Nguyenibacter sp. L1]|uniref:LysR family transcriptional regulator n=1 Tax=Nguyenibacter sp. L1 TaxID=3049350 RepID=UPI0038D1054B
MTLDLDWVRAFLLVSEYRSFTRAADVLGTTQASVSLCIKKLEQRLEHRLFERSPRKVRMTSAGQRFLPSARNLLEAHCIAVGSLTDCKPRISIGITHHLVGQQLPLVIQQLRRPEPAIDVEVRLSSSRDLLASFDAGELDSVIILRHDELRRDCEVIHRASFHWVTSPAFSWDREGSLPIATQGEGCRLRKMTVDMLDEAGIMWREVFVGGGSMAISTAVASGMAVGAMAQHVAPSGVIDVQATYRLPKLPQLDIVMFSHVSDSRSLATLRKLIAAFQTCFVSVPISECSCD